MQWNERSTLISECPLCGSVLERPETHSDRFRYYACPVCGLKWQACIAPESQAYAQVAQSWMQRLSQD
jgi:hypothetical protein